MLLKQPRAPGVSGRARSTTSDRCGRLVAQLQRLGVWSVSGGIPRPWDVRRGGGL